jgi:hypothetical protein
MILKTSSIIIISPICFNRVENCKRTAHWKLILKVQKPRFLLYLDPEVSIFVKIFEFYLVTQSLQEERGES